jgi:hypothetical protein
VQIRGSRGIVHGGGGSAGVVSGDKTPMAIPRSNSALGFSIGHIRGVLRPLLMTYLRGRAHVHGWVGGGSLAPPLFLSCAPVHAVVGMVVTSGYPSGSFPLLDAHGASLAEANQKSSIPSPHSSNTVGPRLHRGGARTW